MRQNHAAETVLGQLQADSGRIHVGTKLEVLISISTVRNWIPIKR